MAVVVFGIDALDPDLVDPTVHPNLTLERSKAIETIVSSAGDPSTHELWPTIITGLRPEEHGLQLDDGVAWQNPLLRLGSKFADVAVPHAVQAPIGAWLLNNTSEDAFRAPATYYTENSIETLFHGYQSKAIGIPNYVTNPGEEDREHQLRRDIGELFERDAQAKGGHRSDDPAEFYELCMEMAMIRIALVRRAYRSRQFELVFGYTSGLDLIGHVSYDIPKLQEQAYDELDDFVGELRSDLSTDDDLLLLSDHGLQDGVHTHEAMVASSNSDLVAEIDSVLDLRAAVEAEMQRCDHRPTRPSYGSRDERGQTEVRKQLEDLGYM